MKTVYDILNKKYDKKICKHAKLKKQWKAMCEHLASCGITIKEDDDIWFFRCEIMENSLKVKERFEETFFDVYVHMHDYWYDLTYQERKKQMNLDIDKLKENLECFVEEGQEIYMPCFAPDFNHLYTDEIVLLDLKQYHKFIRTFAKQIQHDLYGARPFSAHFSSAHVIAQNEACFVLYHEVSKRLYLYVNDTFSKALSLDPKRVKEEDMDLLYTLAEQMLMEDEDALVDTLLEHQLISSHLKKKIARGKHKKEKKMQKQQKKDKKKEKQE